MEIKIVRENTFEVTEEDINDLMIAALEGGIDYWCDHVDIIENPADKNCYYASEVIAYGGTLKLYDNGSDNAWVMNRNNVLKGIKMEMEMGEYNSFEELMENHDACTADNIVQYGLFGELVFG